METSVESRRKKKNIESKTGTVIHPDHKAQVVRLNRMRGQIDGIERMILERRYCPEIMTQLRAVAAAAKSLETTILEVHLNHCVTKAIESKSPEKRSQKIRELVELFARGI